jgi:hypothetical protein
MPTSTRDLGEPSLDHQCNEQTKRVIPSGMVSITSCDATDSRACDSARSSDEELIRNAWPMYRNRHQDRFPPNTIAIEEDEHKKGWHSDKGSDDDDLSYDESFNGSSQSSTGVHFNGHEVHQSVHPKLQHTGAIGGIKGGIPLPMGRPLRPPPAFFRPSSLKPPSTLQFKRRNQLVKSAAVWTKSASKTRIDNMENAAQRRIRLTSDQKLFLEASVALKMTLVEKVEFKGGLNVMMPPPPSVLRN